MGDFRAELAALVAAYDEYEAQHREWALWQAVEHARAVLAQPETASAADGVVAKLVATLRIIAVEADRACQFSDADVITRAADLLERQAAAAPVARLPEDAQVIEPANRTILAPVPAPIPVSERLPGRGELCWWFEEDEEEERYGCSWTLLRIVGNTGPYSHWLPAHALPLPEVDQ